MNASQVVELMPISRSESPPAAIKQIDSPAPPPVTGVTNRFAFIDGLRGIAALGIVVFHLWWYEPAPYPVFGAESTPADEAFIKIRAAVQVLLVISGFVIAYTLRRTWVTPQEMYWFIGRRLVRLVPCYWVTIATVLLVDVACRNVWELSTPTDSPPTMARVAAHMTFLQDVFGLDSLSAGMWTLCIEMQFYFVAVLGWGLAQRCFPRLDRLDPTPSAWALLLTFAPIAVFSLFHWRTQADTEIWVIHFLWMFFIGMATWWAIDRTISLPIFVGLILIGLRNLYVDAEWRYENSVALTTAISIFVAGRLGRLNSWLNIPWLQYLGKISYSLYLIHFPICHVLTSAGWRWYHDSPTSLQATGILLSSLICSIIGGHVLYVLVEAPSARWAARMKQASHFSIVPTLETIH